MTTKEAGSPFSRRLRAPFEIRDRTGHSPGALKRKPRHVTNSVVIHRIGDTPQGPVGVTIEDIEHFFLEDPEGVATVALRGSYADKRKTFTQWWNPPRVPDAVKRRTAYSKIPYRIQESACVPYHFGIAPDGKVCQWLPTSVHGAHARGVNSTSVAIALIRPRGSEFTRAQSDSLWALFGALSDEYDSIEEILTHKESDERQGIPHTKDCPGVDPWYWLLRDREIGDDVLVLDRQCDRNV